MQTILKKQHKAKQKIAQEAIYEAALSVISQSDFEGLKMQEIALAANIATGTLYNYFKNKEDLLYYVDRHLHEDILGIVRKILEEQIPANKQLRRLICEIFSFGEKYHIVFDLAKRSGVYDRTPLEDKKALIEKMQGYLEAVISAGIKQKLFRSVNINRTSSLLFQAMIGVFETHNYLDNYDFGRSKRELTGFFEDYLKRA